MAYVNKFITDKLHTRKDIGAVLVTSQRAGVGEYNFVEAVCSGAWFGFDTHPFARARMDTIDPEIEREHEELYADGRRVSHICATYRHAYNIPENRQHRDNQHPTCRGVSTRMHRQPVPLFRGCQYNSVPTVAANSVAAESQSLPYPSRKPPTRGRKYTYVESTIQKAHQPWDSTREVCAFLALPSVQHARARLPKARPFMRLPALDSQKAPGAFILPELSSPAQPPSYAQSAPSVITLLPASRARRARSHTFRFSS